MRIKNWKILIAVITFFMIVTVCLSSSGFHLKHMVSEIMYRKENSVDSKVIFSKRSGFYDEDFYLTISAPTDEIYYTLDGSEPTKESYRYEEPLLIYDASLNENTNSMRTDFSGNFLRQSKMYEVPDFLIDKCTVLKVAYYDKNGQRSDTEERTYFVGFQEKSGYQDVNIISITAEPEDFFSDEKGIYVLGDTFEKYIARVDYKQYEDYSWEANYKNSGREWERNAHIEVFNKSNDLVLSQSVGIRIQGGVSRAYYPKSLNIYARDEYGSNQMQYDFFGTGYYPQRVTLSSGGNDFYGKVRDRLGAELTKDCNFCTMNYIPYVLFLNGEYWGFYYLTEKYDENYIEHYYNIAKENVVMIKQRGLEAGTPEDYELYENMMEFIESTDMSDDANYKKACEIIDVESFIDYYAAEIYMARNGDWPSANFALWRSSKVSQRPYEDGKWRWMLFDVNTSALHSDLTEHDTLGYVMEECSLFYSLSQNETFKMMFADKLREMRDTILSFATVEAKLAEYEQLMGEPMEKHLQRFFGINNERYYLESREVWAFACLRGEYIEEMLKRNGF